MQRWFLPLSQHISANSFLLANIAQRRISAMFDLSFSWLIFAPVLSAQKKRMPLVSRTKKSIVCVCVCLSYFNLNEEIWPCVYLCNFYIAKFCDINFLPHLAPPGTFFSCEAVFLLAVLLFAASKEKSLNSQINLIGQCKKKCNRGNEEMKPKNVTIFFLYSKSFTCL